MKDNDTTLVITPEADRTITDMQIRVDEVGRVYGYKSQEYVDMLGSLNRALTGMIRLGGRISRDGDLSLFGSSFIAYGVIFHRKYVPAFGSDRTVPDPLLGDWSIHS